MMTVPITTMNHDDITALDEQVLFDMVAKIEKVKGVSRVVYDLTSKPPGTTEWE